MDWWAYGLLNGWFVNWEGDKGSTLTPEQAEAKEVAAWRQRQSTL